MLEHATPLLTQLPHPLHAHTRQTVLEERTGFSSQRAAGSQPLRCPTRSPQQTSRWKSASSPSEKTEDITQYVLRTTRPHPTAHIVQGTRRSRGPAHLDRENGHGGRDPSERQVSRKLFSESSGTFKLNTNSSPKGHHRLTPRMPSLR